jgi:hypothetical protein
MKIMSVSEERLSAAEYQEPEPWTYVSIDREDEAALGALLANEGDQPRFRVCAIDKDLIRLEPVRVEVLRYPPVQIQVGRDSKFIKEYVAMGWHEIPKPEQKETT